MMLDSVKQKQDSDVTLTLFRGVSSKPQIEITDMKPISSSIYICFLSVHGDQIESSIFWSCTGWARIATEVGDRLSRTTVEAGLFHL